MLGKGQRERPQVSKRHCNSLPRQLASANKDQPAHRKVCAATEALQMLSPSSRSQAGRKRTVRFPVDTPCQSNKRQAVIVEGSREGGWRASRILLLGRMAVPFVHAELLKLSHRCDRRESLHLCDRSDPRSPAVTLRPACSSAILVVEGGRRRRGRAALERSS